MRMRRIAGIASAAATALAIAACGGGESEERLSKEEFSKQVNPVVQRISAEFGTVFSELGRADESERVPADVRERLAAAARVERDAVGGLRDIQPPEAADASLEKLERGARSQADELDRLARDPDLTVGRMADAMEGGETAQALRELAEGGYIEPPPHR